VKGVWRWWKWKWCTSMLVPLDVLSKVRYSRLDVCGVASTLDEVLPGGSG